MKILTEKGMGIVSKYNPEDNNPKTYKVRIVYEDGSYESFYSSDLESLLKNKQFHNVTAHYEKVEEIRAKISELRGEIEELIRQDSLWKSWLSPSVGALTCVLESLANASDEMKRHYRRWIKPLIHKNN